MFVDFINIRFQKIFQIILFENQKSTDILWYINPQINKN